MRFIVFQTFVNQTSERTCYKIIRDSPSGLFKIRNKVRSAGAVELRTMADDHSPTTTTISLNNGTNIPLVGLGTFRIRSEEAIMDTVDEALGAGYRLFDTASVYHNEVHLKKAFQELLPKYSLKRDDIFITTKLSPQDHGTRAIVEKAYQTSLEHLGLDYVDLYLMHFPGVQKLTVTDKRNAKIRLATWEAMVELYDDGKVNAIGVSNFTVRHLRELLKLNHGVIPAVNQVEWHPFYFQNELLSYCKENEIMVQAYSSFGGSSVQNNALMTHPVVTRIANRLGVTNAQVLLAWAVQRDVGVIPKSTNAERIRENISLNFKIPEELMKNLDSLGVHNIKYAWDPSPVA